MLRIKDIFLRKLAWVSIAFFLMLGISIYFWIKDIYIEETRKNLLSSINILTASKKDLKGIDSYAKSIKELSGIRVTIIDDNGKVIAESNKDKSTMDNHRFRDEIIEARNRGEGYAVRHSDTLDKDLLYVAKKVKIDDTIYFVRMARDIDDILQSFISVSVKTALLFALFALFAYRMIIGIGSDIQRETRKILDYLDDMGSNDKDRRISSDYSIEFRKITKLLTETSKKLYKRRKQKNKYTAKLKLANRQKDDIISAISHEFKNPIAVISGYSQTLIDDKEMPLPLREKFLKKVYANANKLSDMIDRLRLFIRLDENRYSSNFNDTDMVKVVQNTVETMQARYPDREVEFEHNERVIVRADEALMEIAVVNLIENAIKYSEDTPVKVNLDSRGIRVIDEGIGIPEKEIDKITKKFYRVNTNSWNNSMGIGLSLVANILSIHGFSLYISSKEDEGSTFEIKFDTLT